MNKRKDLSDLRTATIPAASADPGKHATRRRRACRRNLPPGMVRAKGAARWCSVGLRTWRSWNSAGLVPRPIKIAGCVLWSLHTLRLWREYACPPRVEFEALVRAQYDGRLN
jgi:hypothetical protein